MWYYGQKRGGKSGLIPFPRVGRSGANTWNLPPGDHEKGGCLLYCTILYCTLYRTVLYSLILYCILSLMIAIENQSP